MGCKMPRVSIGLPVFNGENYLEEALDSILAQSFEDFELIISDNASADGTEQICREYAAKDRRIRYYRNSTNVGAARNFNRVFELSSGRYFKWAAHDDIIAPTFIEKCVAVLDQNPTVVLCHAKTQFIDEQSQFISNSHEKLHVEASEPYQRFHDLVLHEHSCFWIFGLLRSKVLRRTPLIGRFTASDRVLLAELALSGRFFEIPEYLFSRRNHPGQSIIAYSYDDRIAWFDPTLNGKIVFRNWRFLWEYALAIKRAPLSWHDNLRCASVITKWSFLTWKGLVYDLYAAARQVLDNWNRNYRALPVRKSLPR